VELANGKAVRLSMAKDPKHYLATLGGWACAEKRPFFAESGTGKMRCGRFRAARGSGKIALVNALRRCNRRYESGYRVIGSPSTEPALWQQFLQQGLCNAAPP